LDAWRFVAIEPANCQGANAAKPKGREKWPMAEGVGFEPKKHPSPIFVKTSLTFVFVRDTSLVVFFRLFLFAKKTEEFLSLNVPKNKARGRAAGTDAPSAVLGVLLKPHRAGSCTGKEPFPQKAACDSVESSFGFLMRDAQRFNL
jgi:hypothetical protein